MRIRGLPTCRYEPRTAQIRDDSCVPQVRKWEAVASNERSSYFKDATAEDSGSGSSVLITIHANEETAEFLELASQFIHKNICMTRVRFFNPGLIYQTYKADFDKALNRVLTNGDLILRADVDEFEKRLAEFVGVKHAVSLNSGTDALYLSLWALGIGPGDEVIVPSHTFVATAQVVAQLGATPVLVDMDGQITITDKTRAIIPAHIAGAFGADMNLLLQIATERGRQIHVIEDACQALGAVQHERMAGSFGDTGCFSFYPAKILGAFGDAGAVVTDDDNLYEEIKELRNHYKVNYSKWGINSRMDNMQAAILNVRIQHLAEMLDARKMIAEHYLESLAGIGDIILPENMPGRVWQDFIIRTPQRDDLFEFLKNEGIETMKNDYPMPIGKLPQAAKYEAETLRIPCNDVLTIGEVKEVVESIKKFYA